MTFSSVPPGISRLKQLLISVAQLFDGRAQLPPQTIKKTDWIHLERNLRKNLGKTMFLVNFGKLVWIFPLNIGVFNRSVFGEFWCYPLVMTNIAMENHQFSRENSLFLWPLSIAMLNYKRLKHVNFGAKTCHW